GYQIAPLILIVFIENAFKHSQSSLSANINIDISLRLLKSEKKGQRLHFRCVNNYQPVTNTEKLSKGIGLENVRKRLELLYPNAHELDIQSDGERYEVNLFMQLHRQPAAVEA
ncbi:MAG: histidine kinase, partial [Bacteroidota bacterium]